MKKIKISNVVESNKLYIESPYEDILKAIRSWAKDKNWYRQIHDLHPSGICLYYQPTLSVEEVSRVNYHKLKPHGFLLQRSY
jgi:hypothetical protein